MRLEVGQRFRLGSYGPVVEIVPDAVAILTGAKHSCSRCFIKQNGYSQTNCNRLGCRWVYKGDYSWENTLSIGYPKILRRVENEP